MGTLFQSFRSKARKSKHAVSCEPNTTLPWFLGIGLGQVRTVFNLFSKKALGTVFYNFVEMLDPNQDPKSELLVTVLAIGVLN